MRLWIWCFMLSVLWTCGGCSETKNGGFSPHPARFDSVPLVNAKHDPPPLHRAVRAGATNEVLRLLGKGEDINKLDSPYSGATPLLIACKKADMSMVAILLRHGADINAINSNGESALHVATKNQNMPLMRLLIHKGANVNLRGGRISESPLYLAIWTKNPDVVSLLLDNGADVMLETNGRPPLYYALRAQQPAIAEMIREAPTFRSSAQEGTEPQDPGVMDVEVER